MADVTISRTIPSAKVADAELDFLAAKPIPKEKPYDYPEGWPWPPTNTKMWIEHRIGKYLRITCGQGRKTRLEETADPF